MAISLESNAAAAGSAVGSGAWWTSVAFRPADDFWSRLLGDTIFTGAEGGDRATPQGLLQDAFNTPNYSLKGLLDAEGHRVGARHPHKDLKHGSPSPFVSNYSLDWQNPPCFDFRFSEKKDRSGEPVSVASLLVQNNDNEKRSYDNEFLLTPNQDPGTQKWLYDGRLELAKVLATRRSMLFSPSLALHTFTVLLPPAIFTEQRLEGRDLDYLGLALVHFLRLRHTPYFRRTFALSLLMFPIDKTSGQHRRIETADSSPGSNEDKGTPELERLRRSLSAIPGDSPAIGPYKLEGPLREFISRHLDVSRTSDCLGMRSWVESLLFAVACSVVGPRRVEKKTLQDHVFRAVSVSRHVGIVGTLAGGLRDLDLVSWRSGRNAKMEDAVQQWTTLVLGKDFVDHHPWEHPSEMLLMPGGYDYPLLFDAANRLSIWLFARDEGDDDGPDARFWWKLGWGVFDSVALSALQEMLSVFHHQMEPNVGSAAARVFMESFVEDVEEYFDFDLNPDYKSHFESLKGKVNIDTDFQRLRQKLEFLEQQKIVEKQERTNSLLIVFTIVAIVVAVGGLVLGYYTFFGVPTSSGHPIKVSLIASIVILTSGAALIKVVLWTYKRFHSLPRFAKRIMTILVLLVAANSHTVDSHSPLPDKKR
jgi:hypothetical protein